MYYSLGKDAFKKVNKQGRQFSVPGFNLKILKNYKNKTVCRFTIVVSRQIFCRAVQRNLIKRRLRSLVGKRIKRCRSTDFIIFVKPSARHYSYVELKEVVENLLVLGGIIDLKK